MAYKDCEPVVCPDNTQIYIKSVPAHVCFNQTAYVSWEITGNTQSPSSTYLVYSINDPSFSSPSSNINSLALLTDTVHNVQFSVPNYQLTLFVKAYCVVDKNLYESNVSSFPVINCSSQPADTFIVPTKRCGCEIANPSFVKSFKI